MLDFFFNKIIGIIVSMEVCNENRIKNGVKTPARKKEKYRWSKCLIYVPSLHSTFNVTSSSQRFSLTKYHQFKAGQTSLKHYSTDKKILVNTLRHGILSAFIINRESVPHTDFNIHCIAI